MSNKLGCLIIDLEGVQLTPEEKEIINHPLIGGIVLFARNYETRQQLQSLCHDLRAIRKLPLIIMVDQEGGRVQRFLKEFTQLPAMGALGNYYDNQRDQALQLAKDTGWLMAKELLSAGVDLSLAPVLDLNKGISTIIDNRAFHHDPRIVTHLAQSFIRGMNEAGMAATGKHFPGHGSVSLDSHLGIPFDERSFDEIAKDDMIPFANLIKTGISAIMTAHIVFPKIDKKPVSFSSFWLKEILRTKLKFSGAILSDDVAMEGANITSNHVDRVLAAKEAGCDFVLLCNHRLAVTQVVDQLPHQKYQVDEVKWQGLLGKNTDAKEISSLQERSHQIREDLKQNLL